MPPSAIDFVFALSAEENCPVCSELFASVDQCLCADCGTGMCRDCAGLRPDTRWICRSCDADLPAIAIPRTVRPLGQRVHALRLALRENALELTQQARVQVERGARRARELWVLGTRHSNVWFVRTRALAFAFSHVRTHSWQTGRSSLASLVRLRVGATSLGLTLRTLRLRRYTNSLLIATAILVAVARSQTGPDAR